MSHDNLKDVCRSWEGMLSNPHFYEDRTISGTSEQLICYIQKDPKAANNNFASFGCVITIYDPLNSTWKRLTPCIDDPHFPGSISLFSRCVAVNRKLVLITGLAPPNINVNSVYIYDFESARWRRGADMPTPRFNFACSVDLSNGLVYVAGGMDETYYPLAAAETYNAEEDKWEILPPMLQEHGVGCHGVILEGKFIVLSGGKFDDSAQVFNPSAGSWTRWEDIWGLNDDLWSSCLAVTSSGNLYVFSEEQQEVMKYDPKNNVWTSVASFPRPIYFLKCATEWRDWIFVSTCNLINQKQMAYLFNPSTGKWIKLNDDGGDEEGFLRMIVCATTVQI